MAKLGGFYSLSEANDDADSWYKDWLQRLDEEEEKAAEQKLIEEQKQQAQSEEGDNRSVWEKIGNFTEESNKWLGNRTADIQEGTTFVLGKAMGLDDESIQSAVKENRLKVGGTDDKGLNALEKYKGNVFEDAGKKIRGEQVADTSFMSTEEEDAEALENQTDAASVAGKYTGIGQDIAVDIASSVIPGAAADKLLRGTKAAQTLLNAGKAGRVAGETGISIASGGAATAAGFIDDPSTLTGQNVATNVGIDAAIGAATPAVSSLYRAFKAGRAANKEIKSIASNVFNETSQNGGVTLGIDGTKVEKGFAFSPYKDAEKVIDQSKFSQKDVESFIKEHQTELADPSNKIGSWVSDGKVYLDISKVGDDANSVVSDAVKNQQLGVYDLENGRTIQLGKQDAEGNYSPYAATHDNFDYSNATPEAIDAELTAAEQQLKEYRQGRAGGGFVDDNPDAKAVGPTETTTGTGAQNTEFFSGKAKNASSDTPYVRDEELLKNVDSKVVENYDKYAAKGNFTGHISKMIPGFQEKQISVAHAVAKSDAKNFLDIGASEGGLGKTISASNKNVRSVVVDPNSDMKANFDKTDKVDNTEFDDRAFGEGFNDGTRDIPKFETDEKFDVVNEDFTFQFINNDRAKQVEQVKEHMTDNGVFLSSEKFHTKNAAAHEAKKYEHQGQYFNKDQLTEDKQTIVSGMADDQVIDTDYENVLKDNFKYVVQYFDAGNFKGYAASDDANRLAQMVNDIGETGSKFAETSGARVIHDVDGSLPFDHSELVLTEKIAKLQETKATMEANAAAEALRTMPEEQLRGEIDAFLTGEGRTGDIKADYDKLQGMRDELANRERTAYFANGGVDAATARKQLDEFDAGNVPESVYKEAAPVNNVDELLQRDDMPVEIKRVAEDVAQDRALLNQQMEGLMTPDAKDAEITRLDEMYDMQLRELDQRYGANLEQPRTAKDVTTDQTISGQRMSGDYKRDVRYTVAKDKLDEDYRNQVAELDMLEAQDAEEVDKLLELKSAIDRRETQVVLDARDLMRSAPGQFRDIDEAEQAAQRAKLEEQLVQAERFTTPEGIVTEAAQAPKPAETIRNTPGGEAAVRADLAESTSHLEGFQNAGRVRQAVMGLLSPSKNLEAMGLRGLADDVMVADAKQQLANKADIATISEIAKRLKGNTALGDQIIDYLQGSRETLSATDQQTADMIRTFLDDKRAWLKDNGFATMDDYFPHLFDKKAEGVQRLFKGKTTGDINFGNLKERKTDSQDYSRDIVDVLATYAQGFNKKKFLEPALKPLEELSNYDKITRLEHKWVDNYIQQLKGLQTGNIEEGFNNIIDGISGRTGIGTVGGNHYRALLGGQRMLSAVATMGLNPGTAIRNMTQTVNTVAAIGPKWSTIGLKRGTQALRAAKGSPEHIEMAEAGVFSGGISKNYNADLDEYSTKIPGIKGGINKGANMMMFMVAKTDAFMRAQAYWGAKALAESKGMSDDAAKAFAREKVVDSQFITSKVDMPTKLNTPGVRSLTQLATFSAKQAEFLGSLGVKMVKGDNGNFKMSRPEQAVNIMSAALAAGVATAALEPLIGFEPEEFIPFSPQIEAFMGEQGSASDALYRSPLVTLFMGDGKSKSGLIDALKPRDTDSDDTATHGESVAEFLKDQWTAIIPGGTQMKKSYEGFTTTTSGESRNAKGNIRYLQDMDIDDQIKASFFGQYSTEAGQNWIDEGFPTLSDKQTQTVDQLGSRSAKEQYTDFYQSAQKATGRQAAYDKVKEAATAGNRNKAQRLAGEYNQKVNDAMKSFWQQQDEMPKDLQEQMLRRMYINVDNVYDNIEEE